MILEQKYNFFVIFGGQNRDDMNEVCKFTVALLFKHPEVEDDGIISFGSLNFTKCHYGPKYLQNFRNGP